MKNFLCTDHKVKSRSVRAHCSGIIEFSDVLYVLILEDFLRTIKSLFVNYMCNNNNKKKNKNDKNT